MRQNEETLYLVRQCKNAGTVQILTGHTLDSFVETMRLVRERPKGDVVLCHIAPVKGKKFTGLFHCKNLFYGGKFQNNKFGNGYIGGGLYIRNCNLKKVWQVDRGTSTNDVLLKIEKFLGCVISKYLEITPVRKSKKYQIIEKIVMLEGGGDHEGMMAVSYNNLLERLGRLQKRLVCKVSHHHESKFLAYMDGLTRFISYGGERVKMLRRVRASLVIAYMALERVGESNTNNKYFYVKYEPLIDVKFAYARLIDREAWSVFKDFIYDTVFMVLQGATPDLKVFRKRMMSFLEFPQTLGQLLSQ